MISLHNILSIAKYERKTLLRSWFFRIFSFLSLFVLFGMNFGTVIEGGGSDAWAIRSIPSAIPYFNLLILNVAQAIIAVFLASDFLKRDKKLDTTEVIYMRSMTNGEYVIGKTWGNLAVFLILNVIVIAMALIFNALAKGVAIDWIAYGVYLVLISVPTLLFIMGLSFLLMSIIRNQAITFVIILGYIGITLFLIEAKYYYIFDYMAFNIPMLRSELIGFGNLETILIHRGIYFSLGVGFIFLTIFLLKRLPQSGFMTVFSLIFALVFVGAGAYLGYTHIDGFKKNEQLRAKVIELNNTYVNESLPTTLKHSINLNHREGTIEVSSTMHLKNHNNTPLNKLIFSLNNGLKLKSLQLNGNPVKFQRSEHLILVEDGISLQPAEEFTVAFEYAGTINEALCYLDIEEEVMQEKTLKFVINVDRRFAFVYPEYVLLTQEANWYPKTGVTYSSENVRWHRTEFIDFDLEVSTADHLQAVSQGAISSESNGQYSFKNSTPLTQINLAIGDYEQKTLDGEKTQFGLWYIKGHDYFKESFPEAKDTIADMLDERFEDFNRNFRLDYAFERLSLLEVPAQFKSYERTWTSTQEVLQPEQILLQEKAFLIRSANFEHSKKHAGRYRRGGDSGDLTPLDREMRALGEFFRIFTSPTNSNWQQSRGNWQQQAVANPYFIFPLLYNFQNNIHSDEWPITNRIFEAYLKNQSADMRSLFMNNSGGDNPDVTANIALQDYTFQEILADPDQKEIIPSVIKLKGDALFSMIQWKAGEEEFANFLKTLLDENKFTNISFEEFNQKVKEEFDIEILPIMDDWFKAKSLPGYLISPIKVVKVKSGNSMKSMVQLKVTNFSDMDGLVKLSFRVGGKGPGGRGGGRGGGPGGADMINKLIFLEAHQTKDLSYLLNVEPRMVILNTMTSRNIPQTIMEFFREIDEDPKARPVEKEEIVNTPVQNLLPNEIIVDNEDPEFTFTVSDNVSLLEKLIIREEEEKSKYSSMNRWRPPTNWTATTNADFYGEYVRSAYYIKGGEGEQTATWNVPLKKAGYYDVYFHYKESKSRHRGGREEKGEYVFNIYSDDGTEETILDSQGAEEGWNHLGSFYFAPDTAKIELSNKSELRYLFADAVKLVAIN